MKNKQDGFSVVEGLLVVIAVTLLAFVGFYVYNANKNDDEKKESATSLTNNKQASDQSAPKVESDPAANWKTFSEQEEKFTLKYPSSWFLALGDCGSFTAGTTDNNRGRCYSDAPAQMRVFSSLGDTRKDHIPASGQGFRNVTSESIKSASGVSGDKYTSVYDDGLGGVDNVKQTLYLFYANGRTYYASYNDGGGSYVDALKDFNILVTKTLQFNP